MLCKFRGGALEVTRTTSREVLIPYPAFVYDVEGPRDALGGDIDTAIWVQGRCSDPEQFLSNDPLDMLGLHEFPELGHDGGCSARRFQQPTKQPNDIDGAIPGWSKVGQSDGLRLRHDQLLLFSICNGSESPGRRP